ncbi:Kinetochore-Ndc80 complex, subunit Spc25 (plasmid) [halophilic archaeon DL31]|nr:Kinetochore-Ndc80 complex, subunit Spc25 [halophilic archaeon DL31]
MTVLEGRNATNRTSLLKALMAVLGSDDISLKGDADEGRVELTLDDRQFTRSLERTNGNVISGGNPYLDNSTVADLFAFLIESNDARRAVARSDDLRELIMEPVDTEQIHREIRDLEDEKQRLDDEIDELDSLKADLPGLERERNRLESEIETKRERLADKEAELDSTDKEVTDSRKEKAELEDRLAELRTIRTTLEDVRANIETEEASLTALREERRVVEADLGELGEHPSEDVEELDSRMTRLRKRKQRLESEVNQLQSTIQFNEEMLGDEAERTAGAWVDVSEEGKDEPVTDQLVVDEETVHCWTCGSTTQRDQIEATLDQLRELRRDKLDNSRSIQDEIDELADDKDRLESQRRRRDELDARLDEIATEVDERTQRLEELGGRRESLTEEIGNLEVEIESLEEQEYSDVLDLHREANQLEFELGQLKDELSEFTSEIEQIENRLGDENDLLTRRDAVQNELESLRTRIGRVEKEAVVEFNEHMEAVLDTLDYNNLERIWIEQTEQEVKQGRRTDTKNTFDLHIVRQSDTGTAYEDTVDHLSESEREVTGLIFALAGYLVHEVHEELPIIILDSLEAIDSQRISALVEYLEQYTDYLLVALLPEDASALDSSYSRVRKI